jgi:hypothetical protein
MSKSRFAQIAMDAFFDNFSFAALFGRLTIPRAPAKLVDPRTVDRYLAQTPVRIRVELGALHIKSVPGTRPDRAGHPVGNRFVVEEIAGEALKAGQVDWSVSSIDRHEKEVAIYS